VSLIDLLTPFALLVGVTTVAMLASHGAIYLVMKTEGELQARIERVLPRLLVTFFVLNTLVVIAMVLFRQDITERYTNDIWPVIFPAAALAALIGAWTFVRRGETFRAFICSSAMIALLIVSGAVGIPEPADLDDRPGVQPDGHECCVRRQHADGDPHRRPDRHAVRSALHGRRLLVLPGQGDRRFARVLETTAGTP
jgi:hypothetical protein